MHRFRYFEWNVIEIVFIAVFIAKWMESGFFKMPLYVQGIVVLCAGLIVYNTVKITNKFANM